MFPNDMALQNQSTWSGSGHTKFSRRAETNSMDTDDYSRPSSPLHILPQVSYLRGSSYNKDDSKASQMSTSCGTSGPPSSYDSTSTNREASPTPTTRRRDGVMRLESILNEVSVDPSYALWAASRKSRGSIDRDERYTLPAVEDVQESCAVLSDRASSEGE
ncbi:hypothetical protein BJ165DRAFT_428061 [Panaeolus papilionaceus]|nr:hypothetical protein BJ165DRAFT_428061 [Panaeolus papilionaceus]